MIQATTTQQGSIGIERMCALADVSRASYYRHWQASAPRQEATALRDEIQRLSLANRHYGNRRITILLKRSGWAVNHKRVERIRRDDNLLCVARRAFVPATTDARHQHRLYPNLARKVGPMAVNQLWVADITYVRLAEEFIYLAVVLDGFSRRVIGWSIASHLQASLALAALDMALATREVVAGSLIHHSDRGIRYRLFRLCGAAGTGWHSAEHEPACLSVGQRHGGELHAHTEEGGGGWAELSRPGRCAGFNRPVRR